MPELQTPAPAQVAPVTSTPAPVLSAVEQAAQADNLDAFRTARAAERRGTPLPAPAVEPVAVVAAPAPVADEPKPVSKRQQDINDRVRIATERAMQEKDAEIAHLRAQIAPPATRAAASPSLADTLDRPNLTRPPLTEAEFFAQHPDAGLGDLADYRTAYRIAHTRVQEQRRTIEQDAAAKDRDRIAQASASIDARLTDPTYTAKVTPFLSGPTALRTTEQALAFNREAHTRGLAPVPLGPLEDFTSALVKSSAAGALLAHLADHPDTLDTIRALETKGDVYTYFGRLEARFLDAPAPPVASTVTHAPPPPPTLGTRPATTVDPLQAAERTGDVDAYRAERLQQRLKTMRR